MHYFFYSNNYRNEQCVFFEIARDFQPLNINLLLYGNDTFDNTLNSSLFRAVHDYTLKDFKNAKKNENY